MTDDGGPVAVGTGGTVMSAYADGAADEVEFERSTATVEAARPAAA